MINNNLRHDEWSLLSICVEEESLCGNYEVEGEEECDAGLEGMFGIMEECCGSNCKLKPGAVCRYIIHTYTHTSIVPPFGRLIRSWLYKS